MWDELAGAVARSSSMRGPKEARQGRETPLESKGNEELGLWVLSIGVHGNATFSAEEA
jgi:hypothetical protein